MQVVLVGVQWLLLLLLVWAVVALVWRPFRHRHRQAANVPVEWWRCNVCGMRWRARGVTKVSTLGLKLRRSARRRARAAARPEPRWASTRGTLRCPSCLSRSIRPSRRQD